MKSRKQVSSGIEIDVFDAGSGEAVLFLHGFRDFRPDSAFVDAITASHRLIAPTHPGFSDASVPDWLDAADDAAHIYLALLDDLGVEQFHLVGAALGGWIAAEMATMAPERVLSMTLVAPVGVKLGSRDELDVPDLYKLSNEDLVRAFHSDAANETFDPNSMTDAELAEFFRSREAVALYAWEPWMHNPKLRHRLGRVRARTVFVRGSEDRLIAEWYVDGYAGLLPNATRSELSGVGHDVLHEAPDQLARIVAEQAGSR